LGGSGPDNGPQLLLFTRVGLQPNGRPFDLVIRARDGNGAPYAVDLPALNGCSSSIGPSGQERESGPLAQIRVKSGSAPAADGECPGYVAGRTGYVSAKNGKCGLKTPPYSDPPSEVFKGLSDADGCRAACESRADCGGFTVRPEVKTAFVLGGDIVDQTTYDCYLWLTPPEDILLSRLTQAPKDFRNACCMVKDVRQAVSLTLEFVDTYTGQPVSLPTAYLTFLDLDGGTDGGMSVAEALTVYGADSYVLSAHSLLEATVRDDGGFSFAPIDPSLAVFDPTNPLALSKQQLRCAVAVLCRDSSSLRIDISVRAPTGRTFYLAGLSNLLPHCAPTPPPPPTPLLPPELPPRLDPPPLPPAVPKDLPYQCQCILSGRCACIEDGATMTSPVDGLSWENRFAGHYEDALNNGG